MVGPPPPRLYVHDRLGMEVLVPGQGVPYRMAKRINNPKGRDGKRGLTLKEQEAFVSSNVVP